ncbi:LPS export ABC transporter permease LptG [Litorisediminicola beolgyonensis]|uniref:LPS export ABC transporter permease LptG n=1 Tax=Litorisediminicola beolgyonensis TaxID=1173614 RepID=A0ABW3ZKB3_9RHOB
MILHLYFARRFLLVFLGLFGVFFLFLALLDVVDLLRRFEGDLAPGALFTLTLLKAPEGLYQMLPLVMILSSIAVFLALARSSELLIARAAGRSGLVALLGPALVSLLVGAVAVAAMNPIVAGTSKRYSDLVERYRNGGTATFSIGAEGLWLRQGDDTGQTVIHASRATPDATRLFEVTFVEYGFSGGPTRRIEAEEAWLEDGAWQLSNTKSWPLGGGGNAEGAAEEAPRMELASTLTQDSIRDRFGRPSAVSIWALPAFISELEQAGFSARRYAVWLQLELARPIFLLALTLVGAGLTMRHTRLGRTGISVLTAVLLGFGLYYVRNFAQILGENGQIDPYTAAWIPPVAALMIAFGLILHREDG